LLPALLRARVSHRLLSVQADDSGAAALYIAGMRRELPFLTPPAAASVRCLRISEDRPALKRQSPTAAVAGDLRVQGRAANGGVCRLLPREALALLGYNDAPGSLAKGTGQL
jgi:hypothetical protein